jgi:hypothetical protein
VRPAAVVICVLVLGAVAASAARANGDPASDVLPFKTVFLSNQEPAGSSAGRALLDVTAQAAKKKLPIRVAVVYRQSDLGLIQSLWRKPQTYANFLGKELIAFGRYHGTLVVAMPEGFGVVGPAATTAAKRRLAKLGAPGSGSLDDLGHAAADAVVAVAAAHGVKLTKPAAGSGFPAWAIVLIVLGGAAVVAGVIFLALRRWLTRAAPA